MPAVTCDVASAYCAHARTFHACASGRRVTPVGADRWASGAAYEGYIGRWSRLVAPQFLDWLGVPEDRAWLDVGSGTGVLTRAILERCAPRSVVGVDPSGPFIEHARETTPDPRVRFEVGSGDATEQPADSVDAIVAGLVLNFVPDLSSALAEAQRVVRRGGTVAGYVWDYAAGMQLLRHFFDAAITLDPALATHDEAVRFPITHEGRLAEAFEAAGFVDVADRPIDIPTVFRDFDDLWTPFLGGTGAAPTYVATLDPEARTALRERIRESLPIEADGSVHLTARAWAVRGRYP
jgi:SAM-dependent methyltransferase